MSGRSHRFLGVTSTFWGVNMPCSRTEHGVGLEPPTSGSGVRGIYHQAIALPDIRRIDNVSTHYENMPMQYLAIFHGCKNDNFQIIFFLNILAHLSRRLVGELIVYPWSVVRPSSTMLKHLLLRNRLADRSQILCAASLGRGNEILFAVSGSHDQNGRHAHIW